MKAIIAVMHISYPIEVASTGSTWLGVVWACLERLEIISTGSEQLEMGVAGSEWLGMVRTGSAWTYIIPNDNHTHKHDNIS